MVQRDAANRLYGRDPEIRHVHDLIDRVRSGGASLIVSGQAGIGKSSVIAEAARRASDRGMLVLTSSGAQSETNLPFATLNQLLRPLFDRIKRLEPAQQAALGSALGMSDADAPNAFTVGLAALELLADAAETAPVFVVVDDTQWLDPASADVLAFVARRVDVEPIAVMFGIRDGLENPLDGAGLPELHLEGIDPESSSALLDSSNPDISPAVRALVLQYSEGNPLALIELPRALDREVVVTTAPLPLSQRLERAFAAQIADLRPPLSTLLLVAAIDADATVHEVLEAAQAILDTGVSMDSLASAQTRKLISIDEQRIRFRHPLLRSAVYQNATESERRRGHLALADVALPDPDRSVWHRASAALGPDERCALELMAAAAKAKRRGALGVAVAAMERAAALSEDRRNRAARLLDAAELALDIGHGQRAVRLIAAVEPDDLDFAHRVIFEWTQDVYGLPWSGAARFGGFVDAAKEAIQSGQSDLALRLLVQVATRSWWSNPDGNTRELLLTVLDRLPVSPDDPTLITCLANMAPVERGAALLERIRRLAVAPLSDVMQVVQLANASHAVGMFNISNRLYESLIPTVRRQARPTVVAQALVSQAWAALHLGNIGVGLPAAHEGFILAKETGQSRWAAAGIIGEAAFTGLRGDFAASEALAAEGERILLPMGSNPLLALVELVRGRNALFRGEYPTAYEHLTKIGNPKDPAYHMYVRFWVAQDAVEAAVQSGHMKVAEATVKELEPLAAQCRSPLLEIGLRYARALVAPDHGAEELFQAAITVDTSLPLMVARSQLAYGLWLRRQRRAVDSRAPLRAARDWFDATGAAPLAERARRELRATGENSPGRPSRASDRLTPQELQIAQMAAGGMSNREIGQTLFLSHRTVGFHLYRLFPKLGITSRSQLRDALPSTKP